jgi:uncharacterized protein YjbI with pentapeptide repeats
MARRPQKSHVIVDPVQLAQVTAPDIAQLEDVKKQAADPAVARKALDDAVSMTRGLWISFISLSAYLMVAVGSVTHVDLFLESPLQLPLVGVKVPLLVFFWLAPVLYLIVHIYLLLNMTLMSGNVREWQRRMDAVLSREGNATERFLVTEQHKIMLPNFFPVQILVSSKSEQQAPMSWAIWLSVFVTVFIGPILLLFLFQAQFLPYHSLNVSTVQRLVVSIDSIFLTYFWQYITYTKFSGRFFNRIITYSTMLLVVFLSTFIATYPGEYFYKGRVAVTFKQLRIYLFEGPINQVTGLQSSLFSNRLVLPGKDFATLAGQNSARAQPSVSLRGRRLEGAILTRSNLPLADFTGAILREADFSYANIEQGKFGCGQVNPTGSYAIRAEQLADCAYLGEADFTDANLQGAFFDDATMQGVNLSGAKMQAASLVRADLKGAYLLSTDLQGALMSEVQFQGASISYVNFQGANLNDAVFQGADLRNSNFQGATLVNTNFVGIVPDIDTRWDGAILERPDLGEPGSITSAKFNDFVDATLALISTEKTRDQVRERLKQFEPDSYFNEEHYHSKWDQIAKIALPATYNTWEKQWLDPRWQDRIGFIIKMTCSEDNAPLMAESLILQSALPDDRGLDVRLLEGTGPFRPALAGRLLMAARCPGTIGVKSEAKQILRRWAEEKPACELPLPPEEWTKPTSSTSDCFK